MGRQALAVTQSEAIFLYGALCHAPVLAAVLPGAAQGKPASYPRARLVESPDQPHPWLVEGGDGVEGLLMNDLAPDAAARLRFYLAATGHRLAPGEVIVEGHRVAAGVARLASDLRGPVAPWSTAAWRMRWADVVTAAAQDIAGQFGTMRAEALARRYPMVLMQAAARLRAGSVPARVAPEALTRRVAGPDDVRIAGHTRPYAHFFAIDEYDLSFRRFDGTMSPTVNRAAFLSGDAAVVLPYDPVRDRVLVIEQFRVGPFARGDARPWLFEGIAGRVDAGETPEECARREAVEEAGLELGALLPVAEYYPSPGAKVEYLYTYIGITELADGSAGFGGLETEAEDIRAHLLSFDDFMALIDGGEAGNAPLILLGLALARRRDDIRARYGAAGRGARSGA